MTITAKYLDPDHLTCERSDHPNTTIPATGGHYLHAELIELGVVIQPYAEPAPTMAELKAALADYRWKRVTGGFDAAINGTAITVATDPVSLTLINGADARAKGNGAKTTRWKKADGTFQELSDMETKKMAESVADFVEACFQAEADVLPAVEAGTLTTVDAVQTAYDLAVGALLT